jgi:hypothetical protein
MGRTPRPHATLQGARVAPRGAPRQRRSLPKLCDTAAVARAGGSRGTAQAQTRAMERAGKGPLRADAAERQGRASGAYSWLVGPPRQLWPACPGTACPGPGQTKLSGECRGCRGRSCERSCCCCCCCWCGQQHSIWAWQHCKTGGALGGSSAVRDGARLPPTLPTLHACAGKEQLLLGALQHPGAPCPRPFGGAGRQRVPTVFDHRNPSAPLAAAGLSMGLRLLLP